MEGFSKKELSFKENWMSKSNPQHRVAGDPNKQENDMQYQRYYRNDYKRDKNTKRNNYTTKIKQTPKTSKQQLPK